MVTPGITAPLVSFTTPAIALWAHAVAGSRTPDTIAARRSRAASLPVCMIAPWSERTSADRRRVQPTRIRRPLSVKGNLRAAGSVVSTPIWGSKMRLVAARRTFARLVSRSSSKVKPQDRQRAGTTTMRWPAARADRIMWRSASSTSPRDSPSSRARLDTDRGSRASTSISCFRSVTGIPASKLVRYTLLEMTRLIPVLALLAIAACGKDTPAGPSPTTSAPYSATDLVIGTGATAAAGTM